MALRRHLSLQLGLRDKRVFALIPEVHFKSSFWAISSAPKQQSDDNAVASGGLCIPQKAED
jgi:hypothetical protein